MSGRMFSFSPSEIRKSVIMCMEARLVPIVTSSPGMGKSAIMHQIAETFQLELIDLRLSQCAPEDLMGLPMRTADGKAQFAPFDIFPTEHDTPPQGKEGWLLFLDEINSAPKSVQAASYKLALDRMVGPHKLHDKCLVVGAGNLDTDQAIVNKLSTAMQSRLVHLEMHISHDEWREYAHAKQLDLRVIGFLESQPSMLMKFKPDHQDRTFACPRTWEFVSRLISGRHPDDIPIGLIAGTISEGAAVEFHAFMKEFEALPTYASIVSNPQGAKRPDKASTSYATVVMLTGKTQEADLDSVTDYVSRLSPEFQAVFYRSLVMRNPRFRRHTAVTEKLSKLVSPLDGVPNGRSRSAA